MNPGSARLRRLSGMTPELSFATLRLQSPRRGHIPAPMSSPCICTTLRSASRRMIAFYDEAIAPVGVNIAQFSLMRSIARIEPATLTELGHRVDLDRSTVGRNVRVLEKMGLVALGRGEDQREATVQLSDAGRQVLADGAPLWDGAQKALDDRLGADFMKQLRSALDSL